MAEPVKLRKWEGPPKKVRAKQEYVPTEASREAEDNIREMLRKPGHSLDIKATLDFQIDEVRRPRARLTPPPPRHATPRAGKTGVLQALHRQPPATEAEAAVLGGASRRGASGRARREGRARVGRRSAPRSEDALARLPTRKNGGICLVAPGGRATGRARRSELDTRESSERLAARLPGRDGDARAGEAEERAACDRAPVQELDAVVRVRDELEVDGERVDERERDAEEPADERDELVE